MKQLARQVLLAEPEEQAEIVGNMMLCSQEVTKAMRHHVYVPTVLAQTRSKVQHRIYNALHAMRLERFSWPEVSQHVKAVWLACSDGGTEKKLRRMKLHTAQYFPHWSTASVDLQADGGISPIGMFGDVSEEHATVDMNPSYHCKGTLHFIEKVLSKMLDALALYPTQRPFISSLCIFFHSQPCRVLFLVEGQVGTPLHGLFKTGPPIIVDTGRD